MKSLLGKLGVIFVGFAVFGYVEAWGAEWEYLGEGSIGTFFYDPTTIIRPSKTIARVWSRTTYSEKGITESVEQLGQKYANLQFDLSLFEYDCSARKYKLLKVTYYTQSGNIIGSANFPISEFSLIEPGTAAEVLYGAVCK